MEGFVRAGMGGQGSNSGTGQQARSKNGWQTALRGTEGSRLMLIISALWKLWQEDRCNIENSLSGTARSCIKTSQKEEPRDTDPPLEDHSTSWSLNTPGIKGSVFRWWRAAPSPTTACQETHLLVRELCQGRRCRVS